MSVDIFDIARHTPYYNFHSHTQFCDGRVPMEEMVRAAVDAGFTHWGFSPHSPIAVESKCNMGVDDVRLYLDEVERLRGLYGDRISLYAGMEIDYLGSDWGPHLDYFRSLPLDYRIGSVHFVPCGDTYIDVDGSVASFTRKMEEYFDGDLRHVVESFYDASMDMVKAGGFDVMGHPDKISRNAEGYRPSVVDEPWYKECTDAMFDLIIERRQPVELNTKIWNDEKRMFPASRHLSRLIKAGIPVIVSSDAHFPDRVNAGREAGIALVNQLTEK